MKSRVFRVLAAGVIAGLVTIAAPYAAHAATVPVAPTTTDAPMWVIDGATYASFADPNAAVAWGYQDGVYISSVGAATFAGDTALYALPAPTAGADHWRTFIATPGQERTKSAWGAWGDPIVFANGAGPEMPQITPEYQSFGTPAAIKGSGGTYSLGVAYLNNLDTTVVKAYYVTVSIDPGGSFKFSTPAPVVTIVNTDVATTTSLSANPTTVEAGSTTVLTADVSASKTVTGNVEFYNGATKIGTTALSSGTASYTATVGTVGANTFSAKFVENVVSTGATTTDTFKASTSSDITVTGTTPAVAMPPKAPSDNALNVNTANGATATYDSATHKVTLSNIPAAAEGKVVNAFAYSDPTYVGSPTVTSGAVSVSVSTLGSGSHSLAITDTTTGDVIAWAAFTKTDAAISPSFSKQINADVINGQTPADGEFSLTNDSTATVSLVNPTLVNGESVVSGQLGKFHVTDLRQVSKPGWNLTTNVATFTKGSDTIAASALGIAPTVISNAGSNASVPTLGTAQVSKHASYPWDFAVLAAGGFSGVNTYNADLVFTAPAGSPAGTYTSTLTLTLISK